MARFGFVLLVVFLGAQDCSAVLRKNHHRHHHAVHHGEAPKAKLPWLSGNAKKAEDAAAAPALTVNNNTAVSLSHGGHSNAKVGALSGVAGLKAIGDECSCEFHDICDCESTLKFMKCISDACASGNCQCADNQYAESCLALQGECVQLEFVCNNDAAICREQKGTSLRDKTTKQLQDELHDALVKRCTYKKAEADGWLNADNRLEDLKPFIKRCREILASRNETASTYHCAEYPEEHDNTTPPPSSGLSKPHPEPEATIGSPGAAKGSAFRTAFAVPLMAPLLLLCLGLSWS